MAYITISEILENAYSEQWLPFRDELTGLDVVKISEYNKAGRRPGLYPEVILESGVTCADGLHTIKGFLPSNVTSMGLFHQRMKSSDGIPEYPVVIASGMPRCVYKDGVMCKLVVGGPVFTRTVMVHAEDKCVLIPSGHTENVLTVEEFCNVLKGTGICSIPSSLFYIYTGACLGGMRYLYPGDFSQSIHSSGWDTLPMDITPRRVLGVRGNYDVQGFTSLLGYISTAVNSTLQDRKTVRELAVKHGIIGRV